MLLAGVAAIPAWQFGTAVRLRMVRGVTGLPDTLICSYVTYMKFFSHQWAARQWTLQLGILLIFTGVQLLTMGLLAEMLARTDHESRDKPIYVIREVLGA